LLIYNGWLLSPDGTIISKLNDFIYKRRKLEVALLEHSTLVAERLLSQNVCDEGMLERLTAFAQTSVAKMKTYK